MERLDVDGKGCGVCEWKRLGVNGKAGCEWKGWMWMGKAVVCVNGKGWV
jgi:hypothetical protein